MLAGVLALVLSVLFWRSFEPGIALFANDGPLAAQVAASLELPGAFTGVWNDLFWLGQQAGSITANVTGLMMFTLGPYWYINFHAFIAHLLLGLSAWLFFRTLGFGRWVCVLGGLAAALNTNFFSNAAWGLSSRGLALSMMFLALAALHSSSRGLTVPKVMLGGFAIGMSVSEGGDNGAIFSVFAAAYAVALSFFGSGGSAVSRLVRGGWKVGVMAVCAAAVAAQVLSVLVNIAQSGPPAAAQGGRSDVERWNWATQWSLPKIETLRVIVPGLYGYRMDTAGGGQYWGSVGQSPGWTPEGPGLARYSGAGEYAGVLVVLVAFWTLAQARRGAQSVFGETDRKLIWFWAGAGLIALLLAWGRHAPFYQLVYALPYFSTIRNPMKFMHPCHMVLMILFGYGLQGMFRLYVESGARVTRSLPDQMRQAWKVAPAFEKRWTMAMGVLCGVGFLVYVTYAASRPELIHHLTAVRFTQLEALDIARYSAGEVGLFALFLGISALSLVALQSGWFAGGRGLLAAGLLGLVLIVDLGRANKPWVVHYNYRERYASNPILDILRDNPHMHRVAVLPFAGIPNLDQLQQFYMVEWLQHHFQFYNIQSLDVAQEPRPPADKEAYLRALSTNVARYWQLANGRYLLGVAGPLVDGLNAQLAPGSNPFRVHTPFTVERTAQGHFTALATTNGPFALIEMTNALPRAKVFGRWEAIGEDEALLKRLVDPSWDPQGSVLVSSGAGATVSPPVGGGVAEGGSVEFTSYAPRKIVLKAKSGSRGILLLNDRYHPEWKVTVDGRPAALLRCNYIMRGVELPAGEHEVVFEFSPSKTSLWVTFSAVGVGLVLCGLVCVRRGAVADPDMRST